MFNEVWKFGFFLNIQLIFFNLACLNSVEFCNGIIRARVQQQAPVDESSLLMAIHRSISSISKKIVMKCYGFVYKSMLLCAKGVDPHILEARNEKFRDKLV